MATVRMHDGQIDTSPELVRRLLAAQFPHWAGLPVTPVASYGTDHDIYRLGDTLAARLPRIGWATAQAAKEAEWLPRLAPHLPLAVPRPLVLGRPGAGYPYDWSICTWLPGTQADAAALDLDRAAADLGAFIRALRGIDRAGAPTPGRTLAGENTGVRAAVAHLGDRADGPAILRLWQAALDAPPWEGPDVWAHGDLLPGNLLATGGRLTAVIDFGGPGLADPARDLIPAWNLFTGASRARFRDEPAPDGATWLRGQGWALRQAVQALPVRHLRPPRGRHSPVDQRPAAPGRPPHRRTVQAGGGPLPPLAPGARIALRRVQRRDRAFQRQPAGAAGCAHLSRLPTVPSHNLLDK